MPKKGENIYKRKDGRWEGRYIKCYDESRKAKYGYVYATSYKEVKQKLQEAKLAVSKKSDLSKKMYPLYSEMLDAWLQSTRINIKESTYARYYHMVECHIKPQLGVYPIGTISTQLIEGYIEHKLTSGNLTNGGTLSPKTVTDILTVIKSSMDYAKYNNIPVICNLGKLSIKKKEREMRVLSKHEQEALVSTLLHEMDLYKFGVLLSLYTGIRIGELCALQWEDIDIERSCLKVRKTMQRIQDINIGASNKTKIIITEPKSECSVREIPLPGFILDYVKLYFCHPKAFILTGDKSRYIEPRTMQNRFKTYIKKSGIADANYHSLRHTFATRCVEVGFELKSLSEVLGHANVNITLNKYVHSSFDLKYDNMNKLAFPI